MNQEEQAPVQNQPGAAVARSLFEYIEIFVFAAVAVILLLTFICRICVVDGPSMNKTLENGERLLISDLFYEPEQGDIIVFHQTGKGLDKPIVKRVIATEGQYVKIDYEKQVLYVSNDDVFDEDDIVDESEYAYFDNGRWIPTVGKDATIGRKLVKGVQVPENKIFVMGDNRNDSMDSRRDAIGFVDEHRVLGKVILRLMPFTLF